MKKKIKADYIEKTLENLEKDYWDEPTYNSYLVTTCHKLRKKQLKHFEIEDLRIMIGQNIGLTFLIPLAIEVLEKNILAEGDFYEGDLLESVLTTDPNYWKNESTNHKKICKLFKNNKAVLENFETTKEIKNNWFNSFVTFEKIF